MRALVAVTLALVLLGSGSAHAQSLEKTYADLCSDPAKSKSESCVALAQALVAKLQNQGAASTAAPRSNPKFATVDTPAAEPAVHERWGFFADLVDHPMAELLVENPLKYSYKPAPVILKYVWDVPGEVLGVMAMQANGTFQKVKVMRWHGVRRGLVATSIADGSQELFEWQPDGSFLVTGPKKIARWTWRRLSDAAIEIRTERDKGQGWQLMWVYHVVKATPDDFARAGASEHDLRVWGPLAKLVGTTRSNSWRSAGAGDVAVHKFAWIEGGDAIEFTQTSWIYTTRIVFRASGEPGVLLAQIELDGEKAKKTLFRFGDDGVLSSDWYKNGPVDRRERIVVADDGRYYSDHMQERRGSRTEFGPVSDQLLSIYQQYVGPHYLQMLARERREYVARDEEGRRRLEAEQEQEKQRASQDRVRSFNRAMEGLNGVLSQTNEATGGYAEAQANLDATVADINDAAAAERHRQALAQQQAQTREAEVQRQQLADNARWVAEKEQAAAEHRSAQAEAAAAREEARVLAANAEAAVERARRAEVQRQQAVADATGTIVSQKVPASAGISLLEGPKESGRGGSTCNEELACRKSCAGDVFAVTECVKQCARESACRVGIQ